MPTRSPSSRDGTALDADNLRARMLKPLMEEVGAPWASWHALRHTFASIQLANGVNMLALSRALGHHSPAFPLNVYAHLLPGDQGPALDLGNTSGNKLPIEQPVVSETEPLKTAP